jgi:hypothetical protein
MQKTSEAVTNPSMKRSRAASSGRDESGGSVPAGTSPEGVSPRGVPAGVCRRRPSRVRSQPPNASSRASMSSNEPAIPPSNKDPSTIRTGAAEPTASDSAADLTTAAERAPISSVTSPRASVTVSRVRVGSRAPSNRPSAEPTSTVATLITVPTPGNTVDRLGHLRHLHLLVRAAADRRQPTPKWATPSETQIVG